jgi:hypothetical protein
MNDYWYLCANTGVIKYAGKFDDFDGVEQYFEDHGITVLTVPFGFLILNQKLRRHNE